MADNSEEISEINIHHPILPPLALVIPGFYELNCTKTQQKKNSAATGLLTFPRASISRLHIDTNWTRH